MRKLKLDKVFKKFFQNKEAGNKQVIHYEPLSPTHNAENIDEYSNALKWALSKSDRIKNIAISGPYGSGKSSFIYTFQNKNKKLYNFLNISLANFNEADNSNTNNDIKGEKLQRLIELSILQQMFYREKDKSIPDSRFKKIKKKKKSNLLFTTISLMILLVSLLYIIAPDFSKKFTLFSVEHEYKIWIHTAAVFFVGLGTFLVLFKIIKVINGITIRKLGISSASIEIDEKISKSIFNDYMDEILYFFEATKYNIVVFEDLDRFKNTEIFTKLREINLLLNYSKKFDRNFVFVYAIKDDKFIDKEKRTKFFDFIIPIIPVINFSNSNDKLKAINESKKYNISEDLIDNISLFIEDMRLLYNIMNEYYIYFRKINNSLDNNKLLAIITYKNMYPTDFVKLCLNDGVLYEMIKKKLEYIVKRLSIIDDEISKINMDIEKCENIIKGDIKDLKRIYLSHIIDKIIEVNIHHPFYSFSLSNKALKINDVVNDDSYFENIINSNTLYYQFSQHKSHIHSISFDFTTIEKKVDPEFTYKEKENLIIGNNKLKNLKKKIDSLEDQKNVIRKSKIRDLLTKNDLDIDIGSTDQKQTELISILLRNGYIDEDYLDYVSIFYEGSLTKKDHQFLINIKTQKETNFTYSLQKIENLIERIHEFEFDRKYILNYDLLDNLLSNSKHKEKRERIFKQLTTEDKYILDFIDGYIESKADKDIESFIRILCENWINIWQYILYESNFTKDKIDKYFRLIINYAKIENIKQIFKGTMESISENKDLLLMSSNSSKLKEVLKELDIKLNSLNEKAGDDLLEYIYKHNYYSINNENVKFYLKRKYRRISNRYDTNNYATIQQSGLDALKNYINDFADEYIENIYLKIETNQEEENEEYVQLLNHNNISKENKIKIIKVVRKPITNLNAVENSDLLKVLLKESKVLPTWSNLIYVYKIDGLFDNIIEFINIVKNAQILSDTKFSSSVKENTEVIDSFIQTLLLGNNILNESYSYILKSFPPYHSNLTFDNLSYEKVEMLIKNKIINVTNENHILLKSKYENLHILLIEINIDNFFNEIESLKIDTEDLLKLLDSNTISIEKKEKIINSFKIEVFSTNAKLLSLIGNLILANNRAMNIDEFIIVEASIDSELKDIDKIKIFNNYSSLYHKELIEDLLKSLGGKYLEIGIRGKRPLLNKNEVNLNFVKILKQKKFISSYKIDKKERIQVNTFSKKN